MIESSAILILISFRLDVFFERIEPNLFFCKLPESTFNSLFRIEMNFCIILEFLTFQPLQQDLYLREGTIFDQDLDTFQLRGEKGNLQ